MLGYDQMEARLKSSKSRVVYGSDFILKHNFVWISPSKSRTLNSCTLDCHYHVLRACSIYVHNFMHMPNF